MLKEVLNGHKVLAVTLRMVVGVTYTHVVKDGAVCLLLEFDLDFRRCAI